MTGVTDSYTLSFLGQVLREMPAEMRTIRSENALLRRELGGKASREEVLNVFSELSDRIGAFEGRLERRFDQTERSIEERLIRIEGKLNGSPN